MQPADLVPAQLVGLRGAHGGLHDAIQNVPVELRRPGLAFGAHVVSHEPVGQFGYPGGAATTWSWKCFESSFEISPSGAASILFVCYTNKIGAGAAYGPSRRRQEWCSTRKHTEAFAPRAPFQLPASQRACNPHRWPEDAVPPPRRGKCTFQGTWPQWHFHHNDCQRSRCLSESSHLLLPHQGSVVCRGRVSRHAPYCRARRKGGGTCTHAEGLHGSGGRQHHGG